MEAILTLEQQIEQAKALLQSGKRLGELIAKRETLTTELAAVTTELTELLGTPPTAPELPGIGRKCKLCGETGHIIARTKTTDGRDTCPTYPEGKPKE